MALDVTTTRSRRAILGAALGGAGALFAHALGRATPVAAANDDPLLLGRGGVATDNAATSSTLVNSTASPGLGAHASAADATAVLGQSATGVGVWGTSTTSGGTRFTGVIGTTEGTPPSANTAFTGVYGFSEDPDNFSAAGVWGDTATGTGVVGTGYYGVWGTGAVGTMGDVDHLSTGAYGFAGDDAAPTPTPGAGVVARAGVGATYGIVAAAPGTTQFAAYVAGRLKVNTRAGGRTSIASTATSKKITLAGVTTSSFVVATLQTSVSGCYVRAVVPAAGSFTIYLSKAPGKTVAVGYVIVN
jgi:hypothetical protein